ncbi:glycine--tRNA ligase subunit beta [Stakelama sp. CBK3Z-3]|uniref:Glycine--tRNA ligase beta subunit n=1 Tax=Stakelama flava TaxID=2860338 RepID=A0ABS6XMR6_9SPHN|nr:glycine--tRNA ligase subunit beta [Stakelama flava]MBW4331505.1 glycine--tRNA ligase subunit beta [Stakelama flava]
MTDFLLELRCEEIPARMQAKARADLERLFAAELEKSGLKAGGYTTYATPRRLALIAHGLPEKTQAVEHETKGPRVGAPDQAIQGFLKKYQLNADQLEVRDGVYFARRMAAGRPVWRILQEAIPALIRAFPWPKSMRWGDASRSSESMRWVRPLHGIVALLGDQVVDCEIAGIKSGSATLGHRFHHPGEITIGSADDYVEKLRMAHVIVDQDERRNTIALGAKMAGQGAGLTLVEDHGLLEENAGLTEWPMPLLGRFDEAFLDVPPEVIQLTARVNQKYFVCEADDKLANAFICVANIDAEDGGDKIVAGNEKVLAARLSDARFFYETDLKTRLEDLLPRLEKIVFHEKLGTLADKVDRVAKLARWLVEEGIVGTGAPAQAGAQSGNTSALNPGLLPAQEHDRAKLADMAERAARLAKADLVTGMVGEFPELQGLMGGYYAAAQGEPPEVAEAIRDHYKPVGQGDDVPTAPVTVAVSLADKLDTIAAFYFIGERPTGSKDPFALRRASLGIIAVVLANEIRMPMAEAVRVASSPLLIQLVTTVGAAYQIAKHQAEYLINTAEGLAKGGEQASLSAELFKQFKKGESRIDEADLLEETANRMSSGALWRDVLDFFADRLKVQQREAGVRHDLIDAVFALGGEDDLVRLLARVHALQAFVTTEDGANLLAGYKRAANILKKEGWEAAPDRAPADAGAQGGEALANENSATAHPEAQKALSYTPEPAEAALIDALDAAEPHAASAIAREDFESAMAALASLRAPIDAFFDTVTVNDPVPEKRTARLALLARMRAAVHNVADFSRIEG